jgi:hypothetical protein
MEPSETKPEEACKHKEQWRYRVRGHEVYKCKTCGALIDRSRKWPRKG